MDYEYWLRLGKVGVRFGYLEEELTGSRLYADNKTLGSRVKVHKVINDMFKKLFGKVPDWWLFNYAHAGVESSMQRDTAPKLYAIKVGLISIISRLKWNRKISLAISKTFYSWL